MDTDAKRRQLAEQLRAKGVDLDSGKSAGQGIARIADRDLDTVFGGEFYAYAQWSRKFRSPSLS